MSTKTPFEFFKESALELTYACKKNMQFEWKMGKRKMEENGGKMEKMVTLYATPCRWGKMVTLYATPCRWRTCNYNCTQHRLGRAGEQGGSR
jgi:hypothetical protein